jgi:hypothetical protein
MTAQIRRKDAKILLICLAFSRIAWLHVSQAGRNPAMETTPMYIKTIVIGGYEKDVKISRTAVERVGLHEERIAAIGFGGDEG